MTDLQDAIAAAASTLAPAVRKRLELAIGHAGQPGMALQKAASENLDGRALDLAHLVNDGWAVVPDTPPQIVLDLLRTAARAADAARTQHTAELAWTGPPSTELDAVPTRDALLRVIRAAKFELFLASFVGYLVAEVEEALKERLAAGVEVRMLLETQEAAASSIGASGWARYQHLQKGGWNIMGLRWPPDQRPPDDSATQHAKVAVADDHMMLITSANLTDRALTHNMELGMLIRGGPLPGMVRRHFRDLHARSIISSII